MVRGCAGQAPGLHKGVARVSYLAGIERRFSDGLPRICAYCGSGALCFLERSTCVVCMRDGHSVAKGKGKSRVTGRELRSMEETCPDWNPVPMRSRKAALLDVMGYFDDESVPDALRPLGGAAQGRGKGDGE